MKDYQAKDRKLAKGSHKHFRKMGQRKERETALVVCEGKHTEPFYLIGLLEYLGLSSASVQIIKGQSRSNAVAVVHRAQQRFEQTPCDRVFVLIDAEQQDLSSALKLCKTPVQRKNKKKELPEIRIQPIINTPCFEFWLLLHFRYCDQPFVNFSDVLTALRVDLPNYAKVDPGIFLKVGGSVGLKRACLYAKRLRQSQTQSGSTSPATNMDELIQSLETMR